MVAHKAPLSMRLPGQEYRVAISFLQGMFLIQGSNLCLLHWQEGSLPLSHQGSPKYKVRKVKKVKTHSCKVLYVFQKGLCHCCPAQPYTRAWVFPYTCTCTHTCTLSSTHGGSLSRPDVAAQCASHVSCMAFSSVKLLATVCPFFFPPSTSHPLHLLHVQIVS